MSFNTRLDIDVNEYTKTKEQLLNNGSILWERTFGSRTILYADREFIGTVAPDNNLLLSKIDSKQFYSFLGQFSKNLYSQIKKNDSLLSLSIDFEDVSRDKNQRVWSKIKSRTVFYNVDLSSAYWQIAFKLGYISKKFFDKYMINDDYKEAKRYCISFLARDNQMKYYDGREIDIVTCDTSCLYQIYENIRYELYRCIKEVYSNTTEWIEFNIDGINVLQKDLNIICDKFKELGLSYKINECVKIDKQEYFHKGQIRKF
jgi:hypothetical protein